MSESDAVAARGNDVTDEDCPICLEPLPPFWDTEHRVTSICCGKATCIDCMDKRNAVLQRAVAEGSFGRQEEQLARTCPLCRTPFTTPDNEGRVLADSFEKDQLPLSLYNRLGLHFSNGGGGVERNVERGNEILILGAGKGDPNCQYIIGYRYEKGEDGLRKSTKLAKRRYLAATEQGHAIAEHNLACMLGEEGNDAEYLRHLRGSASKGYEEARYILGLSHYSGHCGAQKSYEDAIRVLQPAAESGHVLSMGLLGEVMTDGHDDPWDINSPNFTRGVHWLCRAAEAGNETAITNLKELKEDASGMCFRCNKEAPSEKAFLRCSRCRAAWYCSKDCQVQHWKAKEGGHKQHCIKWV